MIIKKDTIVITITPAHMSSFSLSDSSIVFQFLNTRGNNVVHPSNCQSLYKKTKYCNQNKIYGERHIFYVVKRCRCLIFLVHFLHMNLFLIGMSQEVIHF